MSGQKPRSYNPFTPIHPVEREPVRRSLRKRLAVAVFALALTQLRIAWWRVRSLRPALIVMRHTLRERIGALMFIAMVYAGLACAVVCLVVMLWRGFSPS